MPRARTAAPAKVAAGSAGTQTTRRALKEKTNTARSPITTSEHDDASSDKFIKTARSTRRRGQQASQDESMLVMTGGLGTARNERTISATQSKKTSLPLASAAFSRSSAKAPVPAARIPPPQSPAHETAAFDLNAQPADFLPSPSPPPARQSVQRTARPSFRPPGSAARPHDAPVGVESSLLALRNFKRRPRQPSMLQMVQQRRASAQPSAFGNSEMTGANVGLDLTDDDEIEDLDDDFRPEAAGTPLQMRQGGRISSANRLGAVEDSTLSRQTQPASQNSRKRTSGQESSLVSEPGESARKRSRVRTPRSSSTASHSTSALSALRARSGSKQDAPSPSVLVQNSQPNEDVLPPSTSSLSSPPPISTPEYTRASIDHPSNRSPIEGYSRDGASMISDGKSRPADKFADPLSSSPPPEGTHVSATQRTDIMADPMTQVSPPPPVARKPRKANASKPLSTSTLQALLPKKRRQPQPRRKGRRRTEFDIDSDEIEDRERGRNTGNITSGDSDEDELNSNPPCGWSTAQKGVRKSAAATKTRKSKAPACNKAARKSSAVAAETAAKSGKSTKYLRTYGRGGEASDKENAFSRAADEDNVDGDDEGEAETSFLPDTSLTMAEVSAQSNELAEARKKFAAVDDWDLDFESVSRHEEAGSGSSQLWR